MNEKKIIEIANLENDCKIGKDRHFIAADRKNKWRIYLGLFAVVGSAIISSGIGKSILSLLDAYIKSENWAFWDATLSHILPLLVGISTAIIGFLGLEKQTAQHRYVGNAYIEISRKARSILNEINKVNFDQKIKEYEPLLEKYLEINKEGESCPTNNKDSFKAMNMNANRRNAIKGKITELEKDIINFTPKKKCKKMKLSKVLSNSIKIKIAYLLFSLNIIRKSDYLRYVKGLIAL
ncbi:SLATT domain-containing protein [Klebsiella oxytoca]|uniref:SLATT domain-containing protein n=1 Tax=Enterobacteriaceae TaxID=543 RepID=UPI0019035BF8|nr:SLATT domain-containing protein [Klebsiella oxytoca]EKD5158007.1 SLATT domain-containing protein [Enterobacter cloacae]MBK0694869.1 SLATT domain-containing protein [Klebsiella oxytoca]HDX8833573.1 SLATT domain-containing protein [Klebsiella oxytoca]HDX8838067.1 SLATT domain-containing protein [Klebsiella oxytoca]